MIGWTLLLILTDTRCDMRSRLLISSCSSITSQSSHSFFTCALSGCIVTRLFWGSDGMTITCWNLSQNKISLKTFPIEFIFYNPKFDIILKNIKNLFWMKNLVRKFSTNKIKRNDTFWEYNNKIPFKFELFVYFFWRVQEEILEKFLLLFFEKFPSSSFFHRRHLNDGNFHESFIKVRIFKEVLTVVCNFW